MESLIALKEHTYFELKKDILKLESKYPFLSVKKLASSCLMQDIYTLDIGCGKNPVYFLAPFAGYDRLPSVILLKFAEELLHCLHTGKSMASLDVRKATADKSICIIPVINPDGYEISLKKQSLDRCLDAALYKNLKGDYSSFAANLRGIDLEYNFLKVARGFPSKSGFGGYSPLSEPESLGLAERLRKKTPRHIINLTSGNNEIIKYSPASLKRSEKMAQIMRAITGFSVKENLNDNSSFGYYFKTEFLKPYFNVKLGGLNPDTLYESYNKIKELLILSAIM